MFAQEYSKRFHGILFELKKILKKDVLVKSELRRTLKKYPFPTNITNILLEFKSKKSFFSTGKSKRNRFCRKLKNIKFNKKKMLLIDSYKHNSKQLNSSNSDQEESFKNSYLDGKSTSLLSSFMIYRTNTNSRTPPQSFLVNNSFSDSKIKTVSMSSSEDIDAIKCSSNTKFESNNQNLSKDSRNCSNENRFFNVTSNILTGNASSSHESTFSSKIVSSSHQPISRSWACTNTESLISFKALLPYKCSLSTYSSVNKDDNLPMDEEKENPESNQLFMELMHASNTPIVPLTPSEKIEQCTDANHKKLSHDWNIRSRSVSLSKESLSLSLSPFRNSMDVQNRSWSKSSTYLSSPTRSQGSFSCSSRSVSTTSHSTSRLMSTDSSRSRSPSIPRRYGSPSFLDRRRITSARKRPVPYNRPTPSPVSSSSSKQSSESGVSHQSRKSSLNDIEY